MRAASFIIRLGATVAILAASILVYSGGTSVVFSIAGYARDIATDRIESARAVGSSVDQLSRPIQSARVFLATSASSRLSPNSSGASTLYVFHIGTAIVATIAMLLFLLREYHRYSRIARSPSRARTSSVYLHSSLAWLCMCLTVGVMDGAQQFAFMHLYDAEQPPVVSDWLFGPRHPLNGLFLGMAPRPSVFTFVTWIVALSIIASVIRRNLGRSAFGDMRKSGLFSCRRCGYPSAPPASHEVSRKPCSECGSVVAESDYPYWAPSCLRSGARRRMRRVVFIELAVLILVSLGWVVAQHGSLSAATKVLVWPRTLNDPRIAAIRQIVDVPIQGHGVVIVGHRTELGSAQPKIDNLGLVESVELYVTASRQLNGDIRIQVVDATARIIVSEASLDSDTCTQVVLPTVEGFGPLIARFPDGERSGNPWQPCFECPYIEIYVPEGATSAMQPRQSP